MLDDPCVGCEQAEATTTCGVPEHPCRLCQWCRDSLDGREYEMSEDDEIEWAKEQHDTHPAPFALCPDCQKFSRHPWATTFSTQDGTQYAWGGVCAEHGPWRDGS